MKTAKFFLYVLLIGLLLALAGSASLGLAQGPEPPEGAVQPQGGVSIAATVSSKFSYQGVLKENGSPVTGSRDMIFRFYSDNTCSTQVSSDIVKSGVQVTDGLFSVELMDATQGAFNGQDLWLAVYVEGTRIGCQEILAVPYALSLRPGATISGSAIVPMLYVYNAGNGIGVEGYSTNGYGVWGDSSHYAGVYGNSTAATANGVGVRGKATAASGTTSGVYGEAVSTNGTGVVGDATATTGNTFGIRGINHSSNGIGVYGWAGSNTSGTDGRPYGVMGYSNKGHGVYGETLGDWGNISGVYGEAVNDHANGVNGVNTAGGYGVRAESNTGVALAAKSESGNIIEAWDTNPNDRRWYVSNAGQVYADGSFHSNGADFAEMLPAVEGLEPGDVLVIGPDGHLLRSSRPYDTRVVGIYSTEPGFVGGSDEEMKNPGQVPVAIVGIVPVKASTENGPIVPGDLLVASSTPGYAMRAGPNPPVGTVIGKALEGLDEGTGVIQTLVMLR